jgi:Transposase DDE domain
LLDLSERITSDEFAQRARHPAFPSAFTRSRKLPLPALVGALLSMRSSSQQALVDGFFGGLCADGALLREVSDRAFAKARSHLHMPALTWLNDGLIEHAQAADLIPRWQGFRLVAADASVLMPALRTCHRTRSPASADQRLFALYLPGPELMLHACVHSASESERAMLAQALDKLGPDDVLLLDRGYPASWLVNLLNDRGIGFVMRCDKLGGGWGPVRTFMRGQLDDTTVRLKAPDKHEALDWGCPAEAPTVRLVRHLAPGGLVRVLATNLSPEQIAAGAFGDLYHRRWRIEEAFKRLKHRLHLEAVSGLSQHALIVDVAAKVLADNIAALMCLAAQADLDSPAERRCNRAHACLILQRVLPRILLGVGDVLTLIDDAVGLMGRTLRRIVPGRSSPRPAHHVKPHARYAYRG